MFSIKASILYLYHRIFFLSQRFTYLLWVIAVFVAGYTGSQGLGVFIQCFPLRADWDTSVKYPNCVNLGVASTILAAFNVLTDLIILVLPMPLLWRLQKPTREKLEIMAIFLCGSL